MQEHQNKILKFVLLGCGRIAERYANLLNENISHAKLVAVCDKDIKCARNLAQRVGVSHYIHVQEMLNNESPDVICILTPSGLHAKHVMETVPFCKNIIVEKPMCLTQSDANRMLEACKKNKAQLHVVKQNRFNVPVVRLKQAVDAGRFGRLVMGTIRVRWCRKQEYYDQDAWRGTWAQDGGVLANQASHHIDLLQWMFGPVKSVFVRAKHFLVNIEAEDTAVAILEFTNGAFGLIEATTATRPRDTEGSFSVLGEKGLVEIEGFSANKIKTWQFTEIMPEDRQTLTDYNQNPVDPIGYGHRKYIENVVKSILNDGKTAVDGFDGAQNVRLLEALYESMATGKTVLLDGHDDFHHSRLGKG